MYYKWNSLTSHKIELFTPSIILNMTRGHCQRQLVWVWFSVPWFFPVKNNLLQSLLPNTHVNIPESCLHALFNAFVTTAASVHLILFIFSNVLFTVFLGYLKT